MKFFRGDFRHVNYLVNQTCKVSGLRENLFSFWFMWNGGGGGVSDLNFYNKVFFHLFHVFHEFTSQIFCQEIITPSPLSRKYFFITFRTVYFVTFIETFVFSSREALIWHKHSLETCLSRCLSDLTVPRDTAALLINMKTFVSYIYKWLDLENLKNSAYILFASNMF